MQQVSVPIINNTECEGMYRRAGYVEHIPSIFICAGYQEGKQDSCEVIFKYSTVLGDFCNFKPNIWSIWCIFGHLFGLIRSILTKILVDFGDLIGLIRSILVILRF